MKRLRTPITDGSSGRHGGKHLEGPGEGAVGQKNSSPPAVAAPSRHRYDCRGSGPLRASLPVIALCAVLIPLSTGCTTWTKPKLQWPKMPWNNDDDEKESPVRMISIWNEAVMHVDGKPPMRGFGGRVFLYGRDAKEAIEADGSLTVYGFVEDGREQGDSAPDRKFVFPAENLEMHRDESKLGVSYNFWIPWDEAGGPQQRVSLICRFIPSTGSPIVGEQTTHTLPGSAPEREQAADRDGYTYPVQQAGFDVPLPGASTNGSPAGRDEYGRMTTTTIPLSARMGQSPPQAILRPVSGLMADGRPPSSLNAPRSPVWQNSIQTRSIGSQHGRSRPLGEPIARLDRERGPWRPGPSAVPYDSGPAPESVPPR